MERTVHCLILGLTLCMLSACSLDSSILSTLPDAETIFSKPQAVEIVSGSMQFERTNVRGYLVQASVGSLVTDTYQTSNVRNYRAYQGVQGQVISEDNR